MKRFKLYNNIVGWLAFAIAAVTYLLTIEPTASFWDCGEFISSAFKLEVGHPPGAPFFMMTGRIFSLFASDPTKVAAMVNSLSALCSAFTILFLFWTITHIARRITVKDNEEMSLGKGIAILGAGLVGALAYTFSDTFWFSAVEGEVYAYSSLFTAVVFWCILKWEDAENKPTSARWLILIAYLMGLSIGVHLLNLLAIPAIVLVYYFKKYEVNTKNTFIALGVSVLLLAAVLYGMIPGFVKVASWFELFFVNTCHLSYNSGVIVYLIITLSALVWAIYETHALKNTTRARISFIVALSLLGIPFFGDGIILGIIIIAGISALLFIKEGWNYHWLNTIIICAAVMLIGYSSYSMIVIRSLANTPMDQNSPEDVFSLKSYLNREQYGDRPLFFGPMYSAPVQLKVEEGRCIPIVKYGSTIWEQKIKNNEQEKDQYINKGKRISGYKMDPKFNMIFPRMYSSDQSHISAYKEWGEIKGKKIRVERCGTKETIVMPTFLENMRFFFSYQVNFMYWRYFLWNFSGRQNDLQSYGTIDKGNWITGIPFLDNARLGDQDKLPTVLKENKGHNRYFMLPLLLGILGIAWQLCNKKKGTQQFWVTFTLFFMTGLAIVVYLNQTPYQPRERDYAYAGSFYAFSIWIGLGVMFIYSLVKKIMPKPLAAIIVSLVCLGVPTLMAQQNWDDHDRSNRTLARDCGYNYLQSCAPNAILFSNGDNDTFPLWYNQEVEGNRTDMRVCNLSYLNTDWYIEQMKRYAYESKPLPISFEKKDYVSGNLDLSRVTENPKLNGSISLNTTLELLKRKENIDEDGTGNIYSHNLIIPIDKEKVISTNTVDSGNYDNIVDTMRITLGNYVGKASLMILDMLNNNNWERPIYICTTVGNEYYPALSNYLQLEGMAYRVVPTKGRPERVNTEIMYDNMMNKFKWGNIADPKVYLDEQHIRMARTMRMMFSELIKGLIIENKFDKAGKAIDKCLSVIPLSTVPPDYSLAIIGAQCYALDKIDQGDKIMKTVMDDCIERLEWTNSLKPNKRKLVSPEMSLENSLGIMQNIIYMTEPYKSKTPLFKEFSDEFKKYYNLLVK